MVALGLLAGPDDFERVRTLIRNGIMARLWRQFEAALPGSVMPVRRPKPNRRTYS